ANETGVVVSIATSFWVSIIVDKVIFPAPTGRKRQPWPLQTGLLLAKDFRQTKACRAAHYAVATALHQLCVSRNRASAHASAIAERTTRNLAKTRRAAKPDTCRDQVRFEEPDPGAMSRSQEEDW
ncbi:MAG TPA: hypothetical protein VFV64_12670, partial [Permianibacter sp.]|nr:hypothetical protein [Permianibacter sp.]